MRKRLESCTLCPSTSHKMVVGDPTPNETLHYTVFGKHLRTRLRGYYQRLWCVKTLRHGIRPTLAITVKS